MSSYNSSVTEESKVIFFYSEIVIINLLYQSDCLVFVLFFLASSLPCLTSVNIKSVHRQFSCFFQPAQLLVPSDTSPQKDE